MNIAESHEAKKTIEAIWRRIEELEAAARELTSRIRVLEREAEERHKTLTLKKHG